MASDLYAVLGVDPGASQDEIKRAYRRKARECHPDAGGDEEQFKEVQHAWHVLGDPERRRRYDRFGDDGSGSAGVTGDPFGFGTGGFGGLGDVIDAFFGGGGFGGTTTAPPRQQQGRDVIVRVEVTLEEVATGVKRPVSVDVAGVCEDCGGSGSSSGGGPVACGSCNGQGRVQRVVRTAFGQLATATTCPACEGTGRSVADPCGTCAGEGRHARRRTVTVDIPPGVSDGDRLRVSGAGEAGRHGAAAGDLYLEVRVARHEIFDRDGRDLWCDVRVPMTQAALGAEFGVPGLGGDEVEVRIPPGTQPGDVLRIKRSGLPGRGGGSRGDLLVRVNVEIPRELTAEQRSLLEQLADARGDEVGGEDGRGLFDRIREAFR